MTDPHASPPPRPLQPLPLPRPQSRPSSAPHGDGPAAPGFVDAKLLTHEPFIGHLAHALRSALNGIRGWSAVIEDRRPAGPSGAMIERAVAGINTGVNQQVRLIDALCDACEILAGRRRVWRSPMRMRPALELAIERVRAALEERGIDFVVDLGLADEAVDAEHDRVVQIFEALLGNAARCTPAGRRVRLTAGSLRERVVVVVEDAGRGLPQGFQTWIFDPFRAADCGGNIDGVLGLGLPVARALVQLHDGSIDVRSDGVGCGTTVTVALPVVRSAPGFA